MQNTILIFGTGGLCKQILNNPIIIKEDFYLHNDNNRYEEFFKNFKITDKISEKFTHFILAVSGPKNRKDISKKLYEKGLGDYQYIDSFLSKDVDLGNNIIILKNVFIEPMVKIGSGSLINVGAQLHHDVKIGEYCEISPMCCLLGNVNIGDNTFVGANTTILPKIKIGNNCLIGAGSVVTEDIPDNQVWFGNPARFKYNNL
jgi:sugar O-acyltransferase (sialic acid O-acetyltransferase NeuD family)